MKSLLLILLWSTAAQAGDGKLVCTIEERTPTSKKSYTIEEISKPNHTVYYYNDAQLVEHFYVRASGMVGGGAVFLHLNLENQLTHVSAFTKGEQSGILRLGTDHEYIEMHCSTTLDRRTVLK